MPIEVRKRETIYRTCGQIVVGKFTGYLVSNRELDALPIRQDSEVYAATLEPGVRLEHPLATGYGAYVYTVEGKIALQGHEMALGDAAKVWNMPA